MQVTCPNCKSCFRLPVGLKDGVQLRCSVCGNIFTYDLQKTPSEERSPINTIQGAEGQDSSLSLDTNLSQELGIKKKTSHTGLTICLFLLVLLGAGYCAWVYSPQFKTLVYRISATLTDSLTGKATNKPQIQPEQKLPSTPASNEKITLSNVRQYFVNNDNVGRILVIEGEVENIPSTKGQKVILDAALIGTDKKSLQEKKQAAGVKLTQTQLQMLGQDELEGQIMAGEIPENTTQIPFMVLFYNPPAGVSEFAVKIVP